MDSLLGTLRTRTKLAAGFGLLLLFVLGIGLYGIRSTQRLGDLLRDMQAVRVASIALVDEASLLAVSHNRTLYALAAEQDAAVVADIEREMGDFEQQILGRLDALERTGLSPKESELVRRVRENWPQYTAKIGAIAELARGGSTGNAMMMVQGSVQNVFRLIEQDLADIVRINKERAKESAAEGEGIAARILQVTVVAILLAVAVGALVAFAITRNIVGPLASAVQHLRRIASGDMTAAIARSGSDEAAAMLASLTDVQADLSRLVASLQETATDLNASVGDLTESGDQLTVRAADTSRAVGHAADALGGLVDSIDRVGRSADEAGERAREAGDAALRGRELGDAAAGDVLRAAEKVGQTADVLQQLSAQVEQIGTIANVIKDIADQTNLLALNAAIEAARAGEQGRGFAVVADEVRKLAERTTASAQEISTMIQAIQGGTNAVVASMGESRSTMDAVRQKVADTTQAIVAIDRDTASAIAAAAEIAAALREQKANSSGIAESVESVARLSQQNAQTAERVARAMADVRAAAEALAARTARFRIR